MMGRKKNNIKVAFVGLSELAEKFDKLGGDLKEVTEEALLAGKTIVATNLLKVSRKSNYPSGGIYSDGDTRHSINTDKKITWEGTQASTSVGYDFYGSKGSGMTTIFLMYGTPRFDPVSGMYDAIYGTKTKNQIRKAQKEVFENAIQKRMEGK